MLSCCLWVCGHYCFPGLKLAVKYLLGHDSAESQTSGTGTGAISCYCIALSLSAFCSGVNLGSPELMTTGSEVELFSCSLNSRCRLIWVSCTNECSACWGCPISLSGLCRVLWMTRTEQTPHSGCHAGHYNELLSFPPPPLHATAREKSDRVTRTCPGIVRSTS